MCDFKLFNSGTVILLTPTSAAGQKWLKENIDLHQALRWGQCSIAIEPRYVEPLVDGICADGLSLS